MRAIGSQVSIHPNIVAIAYMNGEMLYGVHKLYMNLWTETLRVVAAYGGRVRHLLGRSNYRCVHIFHLWD
jgi:hypothetical protein